MRRRLAITVRLEAVVPSWRCQVPTCSTFHVPTFAENAIIGLD
jgi:hypothetical protein